MTGQDGDDELALLVDDQDGRVQVFMADKGRNSADGNACGADEDDQPGRFKSPGLFIVEIGCKRQDPFLDDSEFLQRRLADAQPPPRKQAATRQPRAVPAWVKDRTTAFMVPSPDRCGRRTAGPPAPPGGSRG